MSSSLRNAVEIEGMRSTFRIVVPFADTDAIQKRLAETGRPYEEDMLLALAPLVTPGSRVVDVGANIGNHTLFLATQTDCVITAFEPNPDLCDALEASIALNGLADRVQLIRAGAGASRGHAEFAESMPTNLGGQSLDLDETGSLRVTTLDEELKDDRPISVVKIDVEGMELDVLKGARTTLSRHHPHVFVECGTIDSFRDVVPFMEELGYGLVSTYNATPTHHFRRHSSEGEHDMMRRAADAAEKMYSRVAAERENYRALANANMKYRELVRSTDELQRRARDEHEQLTRRARNAESAFQRVRGEALRLIQERDAERRRAVQNGAEAAAERKKLAAMTLRARRALADVRRLRSRRALVLAERAAAAKRRLRQSIARFVPLPRHRASAPSGAASTTTPMDVAFLHTPTYDVAAHPRYSSASARASRADDARAWFRARDVTGRRLRVAAIVDEFSANGLGPECELLNLDRESWRAQLIDFDPDVLFVESAWRGANGSWHNSVPRMPDDLREIRDWFADRHIPTVFWNKEDPVHFDTFLPAAAEFDYVFTTDLDRVPHYMRELGHARIGLLPFASQPLTHHPLETRQRKDALVFAGGYYRRYPERMRDLDQAITGASLVMPVEIYDREYGTVLEDYMFPESFGPYIVGTLAPDEIDEAYKGYAAALNLNSVKDSTTMFARRVIELAMSGTPTVSNYARGVATMFGTTIPMSDRADGIAAHLRAFRDDPTHRERMRTITNRKVLREHTYGSRLQMIAAVIRGEQFHLAQPVVGVLAAVADDASAERLQRLVGAQRNVHTELAVVCAEPDLSRALSDRGWSVFTPAQAETLTASEALPDIPVAVLDVRHDYGSGYLESLVQALSYSRPSAVTKHDHFVSEAGVAKRENEGSAFTRVNSTVVISHRSLVTAEAVSGLTVAALLNAELDLGDDSVVIGVDPFDFCESDPTSALACETAAVIPGIDAGRSVEELLDVAEAYRGTFSPLHPFTAVETAGLPRSVPQDSGLRLVRQGFDTLHLSRFEEGPPSTLWCAGRVALAADQETLDLRVESFGSLRIGVVVRWYASDGRPLSSAARPGNSNVTLEVPEGARSVRVGVRVTGTGTANVRYIGLAHRDDVEFRAPSTADTLVLADAYPSYSDLYRYGFVHSRVRSYREAGLPVDVFRYQRSDRRTFYEFEGVQVQSGNAESLRAALASGNYRRILVHFLSEEVWSVLREFSAETWITVWVHGAEVQPWWRRAYSTDLEREAAKIATIDRLRFWRGLLDDLPAKMGFVFVSDYFKWEVTTDLERTIPHGQVTVIHNPIDTSLFTYREKTADDRLRILSIRPYANPKYANDLAVAAVVELSREPWFDELSFTFIGDGVLFESTTAPLREFANVSVQRGYLTHAEIAAAHANHGVFLVPTRVDAQGVSRDEAMSSGLVPVTSASTAIPEFVSEAEGYLAPNDDHLGLADAIRDMYHHPEIFLAKSAASAARVRRQTAADIVIAQEVEYIRRDQEQP